MGLIAKFSKYYLLKVEWQYVIGRAVEPFLISNIGHSVKTRKCLAAMKNLQNKFYWQYVLGK